MNQQDKESLVQSWLDGKTTDEEILRSISKEELDQYKAILTTVDNWIPEGTAEDTNHLQTILATPKEAKVVSINRTPWIVSIAASIALIASLSIFFFGGGETVYYAENENLALVLPDGSTSVILSPGAKLTYDDFDKENRAVSVEGRVYFDVTEKGPFTVSYEEGTVSVLGTQFEILKLGDFFEASCYEGSVRVRYKGEQELMRKGERVNYLDGSLPKIQMNQPEPAWVDGEERFENDPLEKVIKVIELRYEVSINTDNITLNRRFTGSIPTDDLDAACKRVFSALGINYQIQNKDIILSE